MLAVDANVVIDGCLSEAGFDTLGTHNLVAPPLLRPEALSVLHEMFWRRTIPHDLMDLALDRLETAPITIAEPDGLARSMERCRRVRIGQDL